METLEKVIAKITVNGKNVTADVSPYLSRLSYADKEEAESDDLTLTFEDTTDHWKKRMVSRARRHAGGVDRHARRSAGLWTL